MKLAGRDRKGKCYAYEQGQSQRQRAMSAHAKINVKHPLPHTLKKRHTPHVHDSGLKAQQKTAGG